VGTKGKRAAALMHPHHIVHLVSRPRRPLRPRHHSPFTMLCSKEILALLSALWMCTVAFTVIRLSSIWEDSLDNNTWPAKPSVEVNTNIANSTKHPIMTLSKRAIPPAAINSTTRTKILHAPSKPLAINDHLICSDNTAETIRATGEHWHIEAADANISMYNLAAGTLGVQITSLSSKSPGVMRSFAGRLALKHQQADKLLSREDNYFHAMSEAHHDDKAPEFDQYLGCDDGQSPSGTAVVVVESFHGGKRNMWHSLANHHGIWLLLQVLDVPPSEVTAILPDKFGTPFEDPPRFVSDVLWPMHIQTNKPSSQKNCFEKIAFMETNSSPYWSLRFIREKCSAESPYMKEHGKFHEEARDAAMSVVGLGQKNTTNSKEAGGEQQSKVVVCYMSRRLRPGRTRHFSQDFDAFMEKKFDDWASGYGDSIEFRRLEFDENVPFASQAEKTYECSVLFGNHGAGLGHMIWMESGAQIIEIGNYMACETYYKSMAVWYGHDYTCFSELDGHKIKHDKNQVYQSLNVTLLLNVLDDAIALHHPLDTPG